MNICKLVRNGHKEMTTECMKTRQVNTAANNQGQDEATQVKKEKITAKITKETGSAAQKY